MEKPIQTPAVGVDVIMSLPDGAQVRLQTFFPQEATDEEANALVDRLSAIASRQRAAAEIPAMEAEIEKWRRELTQYEADKAVVEANFVRDQEGRKEQVRELDVQHTAAHEAAYNQWRETGREGEFTPRGTVKANLETFDRAKAKLAAEIEKAESERTVALANLQVSIGQRQQQIERLVAEVHRRRTIVG